MTCSKAWGRGRLQAGLMGLAMLAVLAGCAALPPQAGRSMSVAIPVADTAHTTGLGQDTNGFATRAVLAAAAEPTLDVQHDIWHGDESGTLLAAGVRLYEIKPSALAEARSGKKSLGGSASSSLHAKTFAVDDSRVFVGTFNFDPRSAWLNTEPGTSTMRRLGVGLMSVLPIEWLL